MLLARRRADRGPRGRPAASRRVDRPAATDPGRQRAVPRPHWVLRRAALTSPPRVLKGLMLWQAGAVLGRPGARIRALFDTYRLPSRPAILSAVDPPAGERTVARPARSSEPGTLVRTLVGRAAVCSACPGRWQTGWPTPTTHRAGGRRRPPAIQEPERPRRRRSNLDRPASSLPTSWPPSSGPGCPNPQSVQPSSPHAPWCTASTQVSRGHRIPVRAQLAPQRGH